MSPHILIIGGGLGGLTLAQGLRNNGISFTVFERDLSPSVRAQGYRIRLSGAGSGGGGDALRECLDDQLWNLFEATCAEFKKAPPTSLNAMDGSPLRFAGPPPTKPGLKGPPGMGGADAYSVDRTTLRSLLLLDQGDHVQFGRCFSHYELTPTGVKAFFEDGTSEEGTLLVGADGVASSVRKQFLPHQRYVDGGSRVIYGKTILTPDIIERCPTLELNFTTVIQDESPLTLYLEPVRFLKDASVESSGRLARIPDYVYWVFGGNIKNLSLSNEDFLSLSGKEATDLTLKLSEKWRPDFRALFEFQQVDNTSPLRLVTAKPKRPEWTPSARVTLLGDAVHAMMPVGSGANAALVDAASLAKFIAEEGVLETMMAKYIDRLWEDAIPLISRSAMGAEKLLGFKGFTEAKEIEL